MALLLLKKVNLSSYRFPEDIYDLTSSRLNFVLCIIKIGLISVEKITFFLSLK